MKASWREMDAMANEALTRFFDRQGGWSQVDSRMPFQEILEAEDDGEDAPAGEYEFRQRMIGVKAFFRFIKDRGVHPAQMLRQLVAAGRALRESPFHDLTMHEAGMLLGESKAAHSWRCKILSKEIKLAGMHGSRLPGQKGEEASESYRRVREGKRKKRRSRSGMGAGKSLLRLLDEGDSEAAA